MYVLTLSVPSKKQFVHAHLVGPVADQRALGTLTTVYPGGSFAGFSFEALVQLGPGRHEIMECDEGASQDLGKIPEYKSERKRELAWFETILFGHQQGFYTSLEVLNVAEKVLKILISIANI